MIWFSVSATTAPQNTTAVGLCIRRENQFDPDFQFPMSGPLLHKRMFDTNIWLISTGNVQQAPRVSVPLERRGVAVSIRQCDRCIIETLRFSVPNFKARELRNWFSPCNERKAGVRIHLIENRPTAYENKILEVRMSNFYFGPCDNTYELVHAYHPKLCHQQMPSAIRTQ